MTDIDEIAVIIDALARIEAKVDALTEWSGMVDTDGRPITKSEMAERTRLSDEADEYWRTQGNDGPTPQHPSWWRVFGR